MNVVVTGSLSYDYIMNFNGRFRDRIMPDKLHVISLGFLADKLTKQFGGTASNQAYTLKLLGIDPTVVTAAGNDWAEYKKFLSNHKITVQGIRIFRDEPCSSYHVITDRDDNQIGAFYIGASRYNNQLSIPNDAEFVIIGPTDPKAMVHYVNECRVLKKPYLYDPAFQIANFTEAELRSGLSGASIAIGNDYEIALIEQKLTISHEQLISMVPMLVTTLGSKGSIIETRKERIHCAIAKPKNVSDPTGAGDAYRAGFLAGYLRDYDLKICGQMGSVAAVYTVETYGTQTHHFTKKEFITRYKENFGASIAL